MVMNIHYKSNKNCKQYKKKSRVTKNVIRLCRGGGYLLSHFRSTIGVVRFNFSVRNGKRWIPHAIATLVRFPVRFSGMCVPSDRIR